MSDERLLVQLASYNTNLQAERGLPQDLVDWLAPTLQASNFLSQAPRAPDIVAVGFQELLPLHIGLSGFSNSVIENRNSLILSQIEEHAPNKEKYALIAKVVNVGIALLWTGCGPAYMGNKGAVGVRFRVRGQDGGIGEVYTFVCAHLTAHSHKLAHRIADYHHIVGSLLFPPLPGSSSNESTTIYSTSHLFFFGDLNFRLEPPTLPDPKKLSASIDAILADGVREQLKDYDQLVQERDQKKSIFVGFREGEFWKFKPTYKYKLGQVDKYDLKRMPAWTDRIMYATHTDSPDTPQRSSITNSLYTSIPSYTSSDHKPIVSVLLLPPPLPNTDQIIPLLRLPPTYSPRPDSYANLKKYTGRTLDRIIGYTWWLFTLISSGPGLLGMLSIGLFSWLRWRGGYVRIEETADV
ncbi:hypothetical protein QCA50_003355 [Cerrena zonata]|uniref:Inositol polyphosphate-related phosphatase domain-containing protein n=1 Tax=Cerrena zonata TaxID=2478898 RepID=A0AAW0GTT7_9APHY